MPFFDPKGFKTVTKHRRKIVEIHSDNVPYFHMHTKNIHKYLPNNNKICAKNCINS